MVANHTEAVEASGGTAFAESGRERALTITANDVEATGALTEAQTERMDRLRLSMLALDMSMSTTWACQDLAGSSPWDLREDPAVLSWGREKEKEWGQLWDKLRLTAPPEAIERELTRREVKRLERQERGHNTCTRCCR